MRLIDADELIKRIGKWIPKDPCGKEQTIEEVVVTDIAVSVCMEIEETPTAYDKEKVIDELEKLAGIARLSGDYNKNCVINAALRIIKQGGLN